MRLADLRGPSMWLSFCDPHRPKGSRFLGVAIVPGAEVITAARVAWALGCNPGGEVEGRAIPPDKDRLIAEHWRGRLLTRAECEAFEEELARIISTPERGVDHDPA